MNGGDDDRDDPVLDSLLGEAVGGERAPDLVAGVRSRLASGDVVDVAPERSAWSRSWTVVAALLGIGVVVALATWPREPASRVAVPQDPKSVPMVMVSNVGEATALPVTTRGVEVSGGNDLVLEALAHLRDLEVLVIREPWNETYGLGLKMERPRAVAYTTAAVWEMIAKFTKLRRLELRGTVGAGFFPMRGYGPGASEHIKGDLPRVAEAFAGLERLPLLESLTLRCMDTADVVLANLPRFSALRHLDLSFNHGFEEIGVDAILQCKGLRSLSLSGCQQLHSRLLARLCELPELEALDVSSIDGINWSSGAAGSAVTGAQQLREHAQRLADRFGMGPVGIALEGLGKCPKLRVLDISSGHWSSPELASLGACRTLRELNAFGGQEPTAGWVAAMPKELERLELCGNYTDDLCVAIAEHLPNLRSLSIPACYQITDRGLAALAGMPSLRDLDIKQMRGLTAASIDSLVRATWLETIDLRHCDFVTAEHVVRLRELPRLRVLQSNVAEVDVHAFIAQTDLPRRVTQIAQIGNLPADTRNVLLEGLGDDAIAQLGRLPLRAIELSAARAGSPFRGGSEFTDDGLGQLAGIVKLERLTLRGLRGVGSAGFAALAKVPALRDLGCLSMSLPADIATSLGAMPLRAVAFVECELPEGSEVAFASLQQLQTLRVVKCRGFGKHGLAALRQLPKLRVLALDLCPEFGTDSSTVSSTEAVDLLLALPTVEELSIRGWAPLGDVDLARLRAMPSLKRLATDRGDETLR